VAGYLGDTVDTVSRTYVHWLRDDEKFRQRSSTEFLLRQPR
jgi:hypothetical protein